MPLKISQRCKVEQCNVQENKEIYNRLKATLLAMKAQKTVPKGQRDGATKNFQPERRTLLVFDLTSRSICYTIPIKRQKVIGDRGDVQ